MDLFPTALLRLRNTPWSHGYSLYEIVYGRPPPIIKQMSTNLPQVRGDKISQPLEQLGKVINQVTKFVQERVPFPHWGTDSRICAWGSGVAEDRKLASLAPHCKGPHAVVLSSPTAVELQESLPGSTTQG